MQTLRALASACSLFAVLHVSGCAGDLESDATEEESGQGPIAETSSALLGSVTATPDTIGGTSINSYTAAKLGISGTTATLAFLQMASSLAPTVNISSVSLKLTCYLGSFPITKTLHYAGFTLSGGGSKVFTASCTSSSAKLKRATATFAY
jgi:hypothetical protein